MFANNQARIFLAGIVTGIYLFSPFAFAYRDGISGRTQIGCGGTGCHGTQPSAQTIVTLDGNQVVDPNTVNTYTLSVRHSSQAAAGFNLAAFDMQGQPAGMLQYPSSENTYVRVLNGELTHRQRRTMSGTPLTARWQVQWRSPSQPGKYVIRAVGNATNRDGAASPADEWNFLSPVTITVRGIVIVRPQQAASYCAGDTITFEWTSYGISATSIAYSTDGGQNWRQFATVETREGLNTYRYAVPSNLTTAQQYRFRFMSAENDLIYADTPDFTLNPKTTIRTQPTEPSPQCEGGRVTLALTAVGNNLSFLWHRNGTPIPGATSAQLVLSDLTLDQAGVYTCVVSGTCGTVTTNPVTLTIKPKPQIIAQSADTTVAENSPLALYIATSEENGATYQWLRNGTPIAGATQARLVIARASLLDSGVYVAQVTNTCGTTESQPIRVKVTPLLSVEKDLTVSCRLYPNPATESITIESTEPIVRIDVLDATGKLLLTEIPSSYALRLVAPFDEHFAHGMYVIVIYTTAGVTTHTVLKTPR